MRLIAEDHADFLVAIGLENDRRRVEKLCFDAPSLLGAHDHLKLQLTLIFLIEYLEKLHIILEVLSCSFDNSDGQIHHSIFIPRIHFRASEDVVHLVRCKSVSAGHFNIVTGALTCSCEASLEEQALMILVSHGEEYVVSIGDAKAPELRIQEIFDALIFDPVNVVLVLLLVAHAELGLVCFCTVHAPQYQATVLCELVGIGCDCANRIKRIVDETGPVGHARCIICTDGRSSHSYTRWEII